MMAIREWLLKLLIYFRNAVDLLEAVEVLVEQVSYRSTDESLVEVA
jgi:hypothetical protein